MFCKVTQKRLHILSDFSVNLSAAYFVALIASHTVFSFLVNTIGVLSLLLLSIKLREL